MKTCGRCGSSARLRYDREADVWLCVPSCGDNRAKRGKRGKRREALFNAWFVDPETNVRSRATRAELRTANRIWFEHRDIREGRVGA